MGANQSSYSHEFNSGQAGSNPEKKCYYEILGVNRNATDEEIKKSYHKRALELHPDRNYGNVKETTRLFTEVQAAYEVLSDPQEKAWYDSHRDAMFVQETHGLAKEHYEHDVRVTTAKDVSGILLGFNGWLDYSDSEGGFYSTLRRFFDTLAREEELACKWGDLKPDDYPSFGSAGDSHEKVVKPFYTSWINFSTKKTFSWMDIYRYSEAPDRRTRRMMERENKRFRDDGTREFNETVRSLVAFVKKRDPRYIPNTQSETDRQKVLRDAARTQAARSRAANQARIDEQTVPEWIKTEEAHDDDVFEEDVEVLQEQFECVVCKKTFKSEKQWEAHERSKKHHKAVQQLRNLMQSEDETLGLEDADNYEDSASIYSSVSAGPLEDFQVMSDLTASTNELYIARTTESSARKGGFGHVGIASGSDDNYTSREEIKDRMLGRNTLETAQPHVSSRRREDNLMSLGSCSSSLNGHVTKPEPKRGKAKEKRTKKALKNKWESSPAASATIAFPSQVPNDNPQYECVTCRARFPSKTRLFSHIRDLDHAQPTAKRYIDGKAE